jgi:hypothetical protein
MRDAEQTAELIDRLDPSEDFNFQHFRMRHMVAELLRTGLPPGSEAPDFKLPSLMLVGGALRLLLTPLALRTTPIPAKERAALLAGLVGACVAVGLGTRRIRGSRSTKRSASPNLSPS